MNKFLATMIATTGTTLSFSLAGVTPAQAAMFTYSWIDTSSSYLVQGDFETVGLDPIAVTGLGDFRSLLALTFSVSTLITDPSSLNTTPGPLILNNLTIVEKNEDRNADGETIPGTGISMDPELRFNFNVNTLGLFDSFQVGRGASDEYVNEAVKSADSSIFGTPLLPISPTDLGAIFLTNDPSLTNDSRQETLSLFAWNRTEDRYLLLGSSQALPTTVAAVPEPTTVVGVLIAGAMGAAFKKLNNRKTKKG